MACVHNQAQIDALTAQINEKQAQITNLNNNITKCNTIKEKHNNFGKELNCVIKNLEGNTVVSGQTYDQGKMDECFDLVLKTIKDCDNLILESNKKIKLLEKEILSLERMIASLQGSCSDCLRIEEENNRKG